MSALSEAQQIDYEDRTGNTPPVELECDGCGHLWNAQTRWGEIVDDADTCPVCAWKGEAV